MTGSDSWLSLLWMLVCVVLIVGLAYWFTRYAAGRGGMGLFSAARGTEQLHVLARLALGREQQLVLVKAGERYFLLGITPSSISALAEFTKEEAESWPGAQGQQTPPDFGEALRTMLQQKRQR
ncbi:MAG: flagellar biosynthetic protein FliO [Lawsonibacter sp.]|nr:flagellar biosynthetic protein FliO [Lawsonibacter sp.]